MSNNDQFHIRGHFSFMSSKKSTQVANLSQNNSCFFHFVANLKCLQNIESPLGPVLFSGNALAAPLPGGTHHTGLLDTSIT